MHVVFCLFFVMIHLLLHNKHLILPIIIYRIKTFISLNLYASDNFSNNQFHSFPLHYDHCRRFTKRICIVMTSSSLPYAASLQCTIHVKDKKCSNLAMYGLGKEWSCTRHAFCKQSKTYGHPHELPPMPVSVKRERLVGIKTAHQKSIEDAHTKNKMEGKEGSVELYKIPFIRNVDLKDGFEDVYPNIKEKTHLSGVHMSSLSPMNKWTVHHGQPGLPPATSIENFHQQSKRYAWESPFDFYVNRFHGYLCPYAHRHKQPDTVHHCRRSYFNEILSDSSKNYKELNPIYQSAVKRIKRESEVTGEEEDDVEMKVEGEMEKEYEIEKGSLHTWPISNKNKFVCEYSEWVDKEEKKHRLGAVQARQFYCHFFQKYVEEQADFAKLVEWKKDGKNIRICGYDAHPITAETVERDYLDASKAFGHEKVLWTMLMVKDRNDWPWMKHKTFNI